MGKRFQARCTITGEPIGVPQPKATDAVHTAKRDGFPLARVAIEMWVKGPDGQWSKDVTCPALAVR